MVKKNQKIRVVKIPLKRTPVNHPQVFPKMPTLYLELLENKAKIKQDLINKPYKPSTTDFTNDKYSDKHDDKHDEHKNKDKHSDSYSDKHKDKKHKDKYSDSYKDDKYSDKKHKDDKYSSKKHKDDKYSDKKHKDDKYSSKKSDVSSLDTSSESNKKSTGDKLDKLLDENSRSSSSSDSSLSSSISDLSIKRRKLIEKLKKVGDDGKTELPDDSDDVSNRLKQLLKDDSESVGSFDGSSKKSHAKSASHRHDKYSLSRTEQPPPNQPPTLEELEKHGGFIPRKELRDITQPNVAEQDEEDLKRELLFKFDLLKKKYPSAVISEFTVHTDINTLQRSYDDNIRRLSLDSSVESYKTWLVYGFIGCQYVLGEFFKFDMDGFSEYQVTHMNSYEKLLIEIGEKSYIPTGSKWPVELRLLMLIVINAVVFIVTKMIMKKTGANLMGLMGSMRSSGTPTKKKKMKGPALDPDELPDPI